MDQNKWTGRTSRMSSLAGHVRGGGKHFSRHALDSGYRAAVTSTLDNSAGRLHHALSAFEEARPSATPLAAWLVALEVEDAADLYPRLTDLAGQVGELKTALAVHAPRQLTAFAGYQESMVSPLLGVVQPLRYSSAAAAVDTHMLNWLSVASDLLSDKTTRTHPSPEDRETLRQALEAAREAIVADRSIPQELRLHLLSLVEQALAVLDRVDLVGADGVMAIFDQMVVASARLPKQSSARGPVWEAFETAWTAIEVTVTVSEFAQLLSSAATGLGG